MTQTTVSERGNASSQIVLERYKYLIMQKQKLNDRTFEILKFYQSLIIILCGGAFIVCSNWSQGELDAGMTVAFLVAAIILLEFISVLACLGIIAGVVSWLKYRREEIELESAEGLSMRQAIRPRDLFRWYETYFVVAIVLAAVVIPWFGIRYIIPRIV